MPGAHLVGVLAAHPAAGSLSEWARREVCRRVGQDGHSVAQVAAEFGVGWATAMAAVRAYGTALVEDPDRLEGVSDLGVDETAFLAGTAAHPSEYVTGAVDVRAARRLDVVPGRSSKALSTWVSAQPVPWRQPIRTAALDPRTADTPPRCAPRCPTSSASSTLSRHPARVRRRR